MQTRIFALSYVHHRLSFRGEYVDRIVFERKTPSRSEQVLMCGLFMVQVT